MSPNPQREEPTRSLLVDPEMVSPANGVARIRFDLIYLHYLNSLVRPFDAGKFTEKRTASRHSNNARPCGMIHTQDAGIMKTRRIPLPFCLDLLLRTVTTVGQVPACEYKRAPK